MPAPRKKSRPALAASAPADAATASAAAPAAAPGSDTPSPAATPTPTSSRSPEHNLRLLPDLLQEQIFQHLRAHTPETTLVWLEQDHEIASSLPALAEFFDWYLRSGWIRLSADIATAMSTEFALFPGLQGKITQVSELAQASFEILAAQNRDTKYFLDLQRVRRDSEKLALARDKHEWSKKTAVEKALAALHAEISTDDVARSHWEQLSARLRELSREKEAAA